MARDPRGRRGHTGSGGAGSRPGHRARPGRGGWRSKLDADVSNAAAAGIKLIPIFWQSVWGGNPASWIQDDEVTSTGSRSQLPAWWDMPEQQAYFSYVTHTVAHLDGRAGFGGAFLDYGWLDAMWGPPPPGGSEYRSVRQPRHAGM
jgi:hypothetical protein